MVKIITTTIAYYLGHKTGQYIIPPLSKFIQNTNMYKQLTPQIREKYNKFIGATEKPNDTQSTQPQQKIIEK